MLKAYEMKSFVHLHTHTDYSLLDGASRIPDLVRIAAEDKQPALGITDHGNLYGSLDLVDACTEVGIKPIIGMETYLVAQPGDPPTGSGVKNRYHLILIALDSVGFSNLSYISSKAFLEGFDSKPCTDLATLSQYSKGILATTACIGGVVPQMLLGGDMGAAKAWAGALKDIFGEENFYVELQNHGIVDEQRVTPSLVRLAKEMGIPLLATNDSHYCRSEDAYLHEALLCVQTKTTLSDPKRFRFDGEGYWLKSAEEMRHLFAERPDACDASLLIAERVETSLPFAEPTCPSFLPEGPLAEIERLRSDVLDGARRRYGTELSPELSERIEYELDVIGSMGFAGYFLIVADIVAWAKSVGIGVGPGRGSAAGSVVAYCLGITEIDPLAYDLVFERFLNPGRHQMPDIDLDIDDARRSEVINYVTKRYGLDRVCQIGTFGTIHGRTALKDAARVLGKPYALGDKLSSALPAPVAGRMVSLNACMGPEGGAVGGGRIQSLVTSDSDAKEVVDLAMRLEGLRRSVGMHAAGVVISSRPLMDIIPLQRRPGDSEGPPVSQYDLHGIERFGLVKLDFLGLRTLGVIEKAVALARSIGECPSPADFPLDDPATYQFLQTGKTNGVFQLESEPMQALLVELQPERFEDLMAVVALYRPGPMAANMHHDYASRKNGRSPIHYPHPDFAPILSDTYGLMIYQESVMRVAQRFAGYSLEEADNLRKACGKKDRELIAKERSKFIKGCISQGYSQDLATHIFDIIEPFADYAFNKSHAAAYALLSYRSAYLRVHYPEAFWAAQIASVAGDLDTSTHYITSARESGVVLLGPDVNASDVDMGVRMTEGGPVVQFGLRAIRDVGDGMARAIVDKRHEGGKYSSLIDLCRRLGSLARKDGISALVAGGACDSFGDRHELIQSVDTACRIGREVAKKESTGMVSLFDDDVLLDATTTKQQTDEGFLFFDVLAGEREALGVYLSGHPLDAYVHALEKQGILDAGLVGSEDSSFGVDLKVTGVLRDIQTKTTRRKHLLVSGVLEGRHGRLKVLAFNDQGNSLVQQNGQAVVCEGRIEYSEERGAQLIAHSVHALDLICVPDDESVSDLMSISGMDEKGVEPSLEDEDLLLEDEDPPLEVEESSLEDEDLFLEDEDPPLDDIGMPDVPTKSSTKEQYGWIETWLSFHDDLSEAQLYQVAEVVKAHPGSSDVFVVFHNRTFWLGPNFTIDPVSFEDGLRTSGLDRVVTIISYTKPIA